MAPINPGIVYMLVVLSLVAVAIVAYVSSTALSLPNSPGITLIAALLPIAGALNAFYRPRLLHAARNSGLPLERLLPTALQVLQAVLTTVLATLLLQDVICGATLECSLDTRWRRMFQSHDADRIKRIQDMLSCCGFRSVRDKSWPFPVGTGGKFTCAETFHRSQPCVGPWTNVMQRNSAMDLSVVLATAVLQIVMLFVMGGDSGSWRQAWWAQGWKRLAQQESNGQTRPLLEAPDTEEQQQGIVNTENGVYGAVSNDSTPRVEPSERNEWEDAE